MYMQLKDTNIIYPNYSLKYNKRYLVDEVIYTYNKLGNIICKKHKKCRNYNYQSKECYIYNNIGLLLYKLKTQSNATDITTFLYDSDRRIIRECKHTLGKKEINIGTILITDYEYKSDIIASKIIRDLEYGDEKTNVIFSEEYRYNDNYELIHKYTIDDEDCGDDVYYEYDNGKLVREKYIQDKTTIQYMYNSKNQLKERIISYDYMVYLNKYSDKSVYHYDSIGRLIKTETIAYRRRSELFEYMSQHLLSAKHLLDTTEDTSISPTNIYQITDIYKIPDLIDIIYIETVYEYDKNNNLIHEYWYMTKRKNTK